MSREAEQAAVRAAIRGDYARARLAEADLRPDAIAQFRAWFDEARAANILEPTAMALATATRDGVPSVRMVLLKGFDERGFVFYTNYESRKGQELADNPHASLAFYWDRLERQVRIDGRAQRTSAEESDAYFARRPLGSRVGAWASPQSRVIPGREVLEQAAERLLAQYPDGQGLQRPPSWGGFRLQPERLEFWQGRASRLHDRFLYTSRAEGGWRIERLGP